MPLHLGTVWKIQSDCSCARQSMVIRACSGIGLCMVHDSLKFALRAPLRCHGHAGKTTGDAARKLGLKHVFHPDNPGISGFVDAIMDALTFKP